MSIESLLAKKGWQGSGNLLLGSTTQDVTFQADFKEKVGYYTVQFNVALPPNVASNQIVLPRAELMWTVEGGGFVRRLVNLGLGNAISGTGQAVRVRMFDYSVVNLPNPAFEYFVSAQVTPGTRPTGVHPPIFTTRTIAPDPDVRGFGPAFGMAPASSTIVQIPQNAGVNAVLINARTFSPADAPLTQQSLHFTLQSAGISLDAWSYDGCSIWFPVTPAATELFVENASAVNVLVTPTWGIEG